MVVFWICSCRNFSLNPYHSWTAYAGGKDGTRYSANAQITVDNVAALQVAWTYSSGDKDTSNRSQNQCNPIVINGVLYGVSPQSKLIALQAATGFPKWVFDPATEEPNENPKSFYKVSRGVMYWQDQKGVDQRIFYSSGAKLYAVNAANGQLIRSFGTNGFINLKENLDRDHLENSFLAGTTPGVIYQDLLITGTRVSEAPGHIRAYDVRTGKRKWIFHTIPHPGEFGYDTWDDKTAWKKFGKVNSWAGMALDEKRGIVYIPTASPSTEYYGGHRKGANLFGNCLLALDAASGKYLWHYQVVHHDLWDRDLPANPNLITVTNNGKTIDAVAQITKHGYIFLLDRTTGKPLFPIPEMPVSTQGLPGEQPWPTQPIPTLPEPFARQKFEPEDISDLTPETHAYLLEKYNQIKHRAKFSPPSKEGSWIFPGFDGGGEWGGAAVDLESQILYVNSSELPWSQVMIDVPKSDTRDPSLRGIGRTVYSRNCLGCHGPELKGNASFPSLVGLNKKYNEVQVRQLIENGRNMMPAFNQIPEGEKRALLTFLLKLPDKEAVPSLARKPEREEPGTKEANGTAGKKPDEIPYTSTGLNRFLDKDGYPGIKPPWGTLNAVDLKSGKLVWKVPLGEYPELTKQGIPITGTENYGGPLVTKGGLVFIAATKDEKIRAFDKKTGAVLWEAQLPAAGFATPATYQIKGRQYVVIACGGGKVGNKSGDTYVAFALPEK